MYAKRTTALLCIVLTILLVTPGHSVVTPSNPNGAELALALQKLSVLGSVLYVAAHPDDENTALLGYLARGRLARTAYLSLTRGDGGQNLIGTELGPLLGLIRTQELLAARDFDDAEQFFTRAIDFGYSKSVDETLATWGKQEVLGDVVRVIRRFRPDVIITRFPTDGRGGHGHHAASAVLAMEAFEAAADAEKFPEQLQGPEALQPWQATRLMWDRSRFFAGGADSGSGVEVDLGTYSPLLGLSFTELAALGRSMHKSQGFGSAGSRGSSVSRLEHRLGEEAQSDLFDGVDVTWSRVSGGAEVGEILRQAKDGFDASQPAKIVPVLLRAEELLGALSEAQSRADWVGPKLAELREAIRAACGLWLEVTTDRENGTPGAGVKLELAAINRSEVPVRLVGVSLPFHGDVDLGEELEANQNWSLEVDAVVPVDQQSTAPYWLRQPTDGALFRVAEPNLIGLAEWLPLQARFDLRIGDRDLSYEVPLLYRSSDRVEGEMYRAFNVVPPISLSVEEAVYVFGDGTERSIGVNVRSTGSPARGDLRLRLPAGWSGVPASVAFDLNAGTESRFSFSVQPPKDPSTGTLTAEATLEGSTATLSSGVRTISYRHIPSQTLLPPAEARLVRMRLERLGERIGYVMGAGDEIPGALRQVGYQVTLLTDNDLAAADLTPFDAIIIGIRAYNSRPAVLQHNARLLEYVEKGGTVVAQYNTASRFGGGPPELGPYPFHVSRDRVSVEDAEVTLLLPEHPLLSTPNRITEADFSGWVQERGLYFPDTWDERYDALLASHDPGEPDRSGGLLYTTYGKGVYIYTGYSFFRELPAGVAGAYRLFVNLISARQQ